MKRFLPLLAAVLCGACLCAAIPSAAAEEYIDNSDLIPAYVPDSEVPFVGDSPDWADDLIIAQLRIETATEAGTLEAAVKVLDHYAEMGVNGLMILPVAAEDALAERFYDLILALDCCRNKSTESTAVLLIDDDIV